MTAILERDQIDQTATDTQLSVLLAGRRDDRLRAAGLVATGHIVGTSFGSVYGLIGDGRRPSLGYDIATVKGRGQLRRPLSVCLPAARLSELIDLAHVHPSLRSWALDGAGLAWSLSSRCYLRVPVRRSMARCIPPHLLSYVDGVPYLQSLDPSGLAEIGEFVATVRAAGVEFPAVTSMNITGSPAIVEYDEAMHFAAVAGLPALLLGPTEPRLRGPLSILALGPSGLSIARAGTYGAAQLQRLLSVPIETTAGGALG